MRVFTVDEWINECVNGGGLLDDLVNELGNVFPMADYPPRQKSRYASAEKKDGYYYIQVMAPNLDKDKIKVSFSDKKLRVKLNYDENIFGSEVQNDHNIYLPDADPEAVSPVLKNGVLMIKVGILEKKKEKTFDVK